MSPTASQAISPAGQPAAAATFIRPGARFELRFKPLHMRRGEYRFPCNAGGAVDMDAMSDGARNDYFFARALIGRDYAAPAVEDCAICLERPHARSRAS